MARPAVATLGWLRVLPEAGAIFDRMADEERELLERRRARQTDISRIDARLMSLRGVAVRIARQHYTPEEIQAAGGPVEVRRARTKKGGAKRCR